MTDDHSPLDPGSDPRPTGPLDDEVVSAVLDGEATPGERALVEGSIEGRARLVQLRIAADATAVPVGPLAPTTVDRMIGRALDTGSVAITPVELTSRRAPRARSEGWRRFGTAVAAAAAIVVVVAGVVALGKASGRSSSSSDSASSATGANESAVSSSIAPGGDSARTANGVVPPDLGALPDADLVLDRYTVLVGIDPTVDHSFTTGPASGSGSSTAAESSGQAPAADADADAATLSPTACPVPPVPTSAGETWTVTATARLPEGPVLVMGNGLAAPANRVLVVDVATCTVLAERTL